MAKVVHISSLVLRADPSKLADVIAAVEAVDAAEVPMSDPSGKIVVTLETASEAEIVDHLNKLSLVDGVASASLVYHQTEVETEPAGEQRNERKP